MITKYCLGYTHDKCDKCRMTKMGEFEEHITLKDGDKDRR